VPRVLIVDDHRSTRESLAIGMLVVGFEADTAPDAARALALAAEREYDVVVSDVRMPEVDGITLCRQLAAIHPGLRFVLMTAYEVSPAESTALRALGATLLIKPVTITALTACCEDGGAAKRTTGV
jgi:DNA-binding NtrC family response regulator